MDTQTRIGADIATTSGKTQRREFRVLSKFVTKIKRSCSFLQSSKSRKHTSSCVMKFFPLSFSTRKASISLSHPASITALHRACFLGRSSLSIISIIKAKRWMVDTPDLLGRLPLHITVICICDGTLPLADGLQVIYRLCSVYLQGIHATDISSDTPSDIAHDAMIQLNSRSSGGGGINRGVEYQRKKKILYTLIHHLSHISIYSYLERKQIWERRETPFYDGEDCELSSLVVVSSTKGSVYSDEKTCPINY